MIVDNYSAHPEIGSLKAIKLCFLSPNTTSQPMYQGVIRSLKAQYRFPNDSTIVIRNRNLFLMTMIQQIIKAIDVNQSIPKMNIFDVMKMLTVS